MAGKELTEDHKDKLDRLEEVLIEFADRDQRMDLPMLRVLTAVCRHDGVGLHELSSHLGYPLSVVSRHALDMGAEPTLMRGQPPLGLMEFTGSTTTGRRITLTPKGVEFRDRLLALMC
jgi:hypothetical protein